MKIDYYRIYLFVCFFVCNISIAGEEFVNNFMFGDPKEKISYLGQRLLTYGLFGYLGSKFIDKVRVIPKLQNTKIGSVLSSKIFKRLSIGIGLFGAYKFNGYLSDFIKFVNLKMYSDSKLERDLTILDNLGKVTNLDESSKLILENAKKLLAEALQLRKKIKEEDLEKEISVESKKSFEKIILKLNIMFSEFLKINSSSKTVLFKALCEKDLNCAKVLPTNLTNKIAELLEIVLGKLDEFTKITEKDFIDYLYLITRYAKNTIVFLEELRPRQLNTEDFTKEESNLLKKAEQYILSKERVKRAVGSKKNPKKVRELETKRYEIPVFAVNPIFKILNKDYFPAMEGDWWADEYQSGDTGEEAKKLEKEKLETSQKLAKGASLLNTEIKKTDFEVKNRSDITYAKKITNEKELQDIIVSAWFLIVPDIRKDFRITENDENDDDKVLGENNQAKFGLDLKKNQMREIVENNEENIAAKAKNRDKSAWNGVEIYPNVGWLIYKYYLQKSQLDAKDELFTYGSFTPTLCLPNNEEHKETINNTGIPYYVSAEYIKIDLSENLIISLNEKYNLVEENSKLERDGKLVDPYFSKKAELEMQKNDLGKEIAVVK